MPPLARPVFLSAVVPQPPSSTPTQPEPSELSTHLSQLQTDTQTVYAAILALSTEPQDFIDADDICFIRGRVNVLLAMQPRNASQLVMANLLYYEIVGRIEAIAEHHNCQLLKDLPVRLRLFCECTSGTTSTP